VYWIDLVPNGDKWRDVVDTVMNIKFNKVQVICGDRGSTVVKVLCYNSDGRWFDPSWCQWIFH